MGGIEKSGAGRQSDPRAWLARAPLVAAVVLGVAIAVQAADIAATLFGDVGITSGSGPEAASTTHDSRQGAAARTAISALTAAHLFGLAPSATATRSANVSRAPLVLTGIIATGDPADGFAILGASAETALLFHAGSQAAPGTILAEVYPRRVVLLRGAERLILTLPKAGAAIPIDGESPGIRMASAASEPRLASAGGGSGMAAEPPPESFKPPRMSDASALMRAFSMRPVSINGQRGVRIMGTGINSATLTALGLAPGDVILQINGVAVGSRDTPDLAQALKSGSATLVVDRGGDATSVTIDSSTAATAAEDYRQASPDP